MGEDTETTVETTVDTANTTEQGALTEETIIRNLSQLQTLVCYHVQPPMYCLPFADLELFVNPDFETETFEGWTQEGCVIDSSIKHTGSYSAMLYEAYMYQDFPNVPKECIETLGFWAIGSPYNDVYIYYDDETFTYLGIDFFNGKVNGSTWTWIDLFNQIPEGKKVSRIKFMGGTGAPWWIDDCSLKGRSM